MSNNRSLPDTPPATGIHGSALGALLPTGFDRARPVGLIAGQGYYPEATLAGLRALGAEVRLVAFAGETRFEVRQQFAAAHQVLLQVGQLGAMLAALRRWQCGYAIMVGQISPRRLFQGLHPDWGALRLLASLRERNAHTIFGAIVRAIEAQGTTVLDARVGLEGDLATAGHLAGPPLPVPASDLDFGIRVARDCARLDIGQGVVVKRGTVIAVEDYAGTDALLRRAGELPARHMLYVKLAKPGHDFRFDVPVVGVKTVAALDRARIRVAAVEAGRCLLLDRPAVLAAAAQTGLTLVGFGS